MLIYKIMSFDEWNAFQMSGTYEGSAVDRDDGFIHFSTKEQTAETANKHFSGQHNLMLVAINAADLGKELVYEPSRGGQLFPHLYKSLSFQDVRDSTTFEPSKDGSFQFPEGFS